MAPCLPVQPDSSMRLSRSIATSRFSSVWTICLSPLSSSELGQIVWPIFAPLFRYSCKLCQICGRAKSHGSRPNPAFERTCRRERRDRVKRLCRRPAAQLVGRLAKRGHPLAGRCQASKRFHGGASRRFSISPSSVCSCRSRPFLHFMAATNRARHPSGSSERR